MLTMLKCATVDHISSNTGYSGLVEGVWDQGGVHKYSHFSISWLTLFS